MCVSEYKKYDTYEKTFFFFANPTRFVSFRLVPFRFEYKKYDSYEKHVVVLQTPTRFVLFLYVLFRFVSLSLLCFGVVCLLCGCFASLKRVGTVRRGMRCEREHSAFARVSCGASRGGGSEARAGGGVQDHGGGLPEDVGLFSFFFSFSSDEWVKIKVKPPRPILEPFAV